ncbi:rho guanine nucleotide exchange factor 11 isoform X3 [Eucyclogobius newberryi]|uniref:rho guanine nucleotide exchange factor 11 isoform X3 n=1 Tax=Eucyclogobius newberryi TaxID=166745 RepID=UPI003B594566
MSLRQPTSTLDRATNKKNARLSSPFAAWLSSLTIGDSERKSSAAQQREPCADIPTESSGTGLVQRCVVVQKDQLGFGFTVCGERVKLVQNVRPGGAAVKAGVQEGDRIIKVNGSMVSSMTHQEVVKLIKSGTYVALTLQGPPPSAASVPLEPLPTDLSPNPRTSLGGQIPPPPPPPLPSGLSSTQRITGPKPLQDPEVQKHATEILRKMLEQEEAELQVLLEERLRNPSPSLEERIESAKRRAHQVRIKIQQDQEGSRPESVTSYILAGGRLSMDSGEGDMEAFDSPHSSPSSSFRTSQHRRHNSDTHPLSNSTGKAQIISPEDEDEEDDGYEFVEMDGPFQDIELLKSRPAHMTVFMRYVLCQLLDPNPLLFYLSVEAYLGSSTKDARALAPQICSHFLDPDAPLKIKVREEYLTDIETRLHAQEDIRGPLSELQQQVLPDIQEQIQDYRNKQMMGLGSLFGEGDLLQLDGDPAKERQVVDRQLTALWEILSKHEEDRSSPIASVVLLYLRHSGIKLRDSKVFPGLSIEKDKWLAFLKSKKLSSAKKDKDKDGEDKKRNPILKYIGKPRNTSQSTFHAPLSPSEVRPGNVRNIIQQFESSSEAGEEGDSSDSQRLSSSSLGEDGMDSPTISVRLARSESLKAQGEGRRRGAGLGPESVPRSRSDVDMEECGEERESAGLRPLQHSASSSASSSSARSLENPTPPYTPRSRRRSVDSPLALLPDAAALEDEVCETQNWQKTVPAQLLATLSPKEVDRQAVIYELFMTEVSHLRTLRVLDQVFYQKMRTVLNSDELACVFPNLQQVYELHASLCEAMVKRRESPIVPDIGDVILARFEGAAGEEFQEQTAQLCSQQSQALELIRNKQRKDPRFAHVIQECESSPHCRRLQLKDLLVCEMQRLTKYPLLLDNIIKHTDAGSSDLASLHRAQASCRGILQYVNVVVGETEQRLRLAQYQRRLDAAPQFKSLDLTTKRMIHEGPLTWKVSKDKQLEIQALLLSDFLVLLQRGPDERLQLRYPSRWLGGGGGPTGEGKTSFSPLVKLDSLLVRSVATDNKALYVISATERQIYELVAGTASEKNTWKDLLDKTISQAAGSSPVINHGSMRLSSQSVGNSSPVSTTEEISLIEQQDSRGNHSPANEELAADTSSEQDSFFSSERPEAGVAEAALQDVEALRQLILRDLEDDGWSQDSDDTPTNETAADGSFTEKQRPGSLETVLNFSTSDEPEEPDAPEQPRVVRKAVVGGSFSSSVPGGITDDVALSSSSSSSDRSAEPSGNIFYLVMPSDHGESATDDPVADDPANDDPATPVATNFPPHLQEVMSSAARTDQQEVPALDRPEATPPGQENGTGQSEAAAQSHVIKNVDEIFHTIEGLMNKLRHLREIEEAHQKLLQNLRASSQDSDDCSSASVSRTPSLGSADGKERSSELKIQSTGF